MADICRRYFEMHFLELKFFDFTEAFLSGGIDNKPNLVQVMDCSLFGAKPLPEAMSTWVYESDIWRH